MKAGLICASALIGLAFIAARAWSRVGRAIDEAFGDIPFLHGELAAPGIRGGEGVKADAACEAIARSHGEGL